MNGNITKEYVDSICLALNAQFESVEPSVRSSSEKLLNEFAKIPEFIPCSLLMLANVALQANTRKALAILLEKKILSLSHVREFNEEELKQYALMFVESLCEEKIELEHKQMIQNCIQTMCYAQIEGKLLGDEDNELWGLLLPSLWELISKLNINLMYGGISAIEAILKGSFNFAIPEKDPEGFVNNLTQLGSKLLSELNLQQSLGNEMM